MCGICGYIGLDDKELLKKMMSAISHRGPDDFGHYFGEKIALGHLRLSVIDLSPRGHQPMANEDSTIWITYNGEIYNYKELKKELESKHHFKSDTDTEVVIHAYEEWGIDCLKKFNGMFVFGLLDIQNRQFLLVRDRMGIKPLHYVYIDNKLFFASELKALLKIDGIDKEIDRGSLNYYLMLGYVPSPKSIIKGFSKLPSGHYLLFKDGKTTINKYWELKYEPKNQGDKLEDCCQQIRFLLADAVKKRLMSDVPLGIFLSGGIDSSALLGLASKFSSSPVKTFSIGFKEDSFNELRYARLAASHFGAEHQQFILEYKLLYQMLPEILNFFDEPVADPSFLPTYLLSKLTREHVTVALGGDGCDELFGGYVTHQNVSLAYAYQKLPSFIKSRLFEPVIKHLPMSYNYMSLDFKAKGFARGIRYPIEVANLLWLGVFSPQECNRLIKGRVEQSTYESLLFDLTEDCSKEDKIALLDKILYLDMRFFLQDDLLSKVDLMSMAHALEVRVPFLDYRLVELIAKLPANLKVKAFTTKYILKRALSDLLPKEILYRKKQGFSVPVAEWLQKDEVKDFVLDVFHREKIEKEGFFDSGYISKLLQDHFKKKANNWKQIWALLIFELWLEKLKDYR